MNSKKRTRKPTTVGEMLEKEFLVPLGISQETFAQHLKVDVKVIKDIVHNKRPLRPKLALKIASAFGSSPDFWMNLQHSNDLTELTRLKSNLPHGTITK